MHELLEERRPNRETLSTTDVQEMNEIPSSSLHRDADYLHVPQRESEIGKSKDEQVLLMTCKVKITAPNRSSMIARALIDPVSSSSFLRECLAQYLCFLRSNKNAEVEGTGETSMPT